MQYLVLAQYGTLSSRPFHGTLGRGTAARCCEVLLASWQTVMGPAVPGTMAALRVGLAHWGLLHGYAVLTLAAQP